MKNEGMPKEPDGGEPSSFPRDFLMTCDPGHIASRLPSVEGLCFIYCCLNRGVWEDISLGHCTHNVLGVTRTWTSTEPRVEINRERGESRVPLGSRYGTTLDSSPRGRWRCVIRRIYSAHCLDFVEQISSWSKVSIPPIIF
jgi:hypothetical protein